MLVFVAIYLMVQMLVRSHNKMPLPKMEDVYSDFDSSHSSSDGHGDSHWSDVSAEYSVRTPSAWANLGMFVCGARVWTIL